MKFKYGFGLVAALLSIGTESALAQGFKLSAAPTVVERLDGFKVLKKGQLTAVHNIKVEVVKGKTVKVRTLADKAFEGVKTFKNNLAARKGKGVLAKSIREDTFGAETDDFVLIARSVTAVVTDPMEVKKRSPFYKKLLEDQPVLKVSTFKLSEMPKSWRPGIDAFVAKAKALPKRHPLRKAYDKNGKKGVLVAAFNGEGTVTLTEKLVIPKKLGRFKKGKTGFFNFDYGKKKKDGKRFNKKPKFVEKSLKSGWQGDTKVKLKTVKPKGMLPLDDDKVVSPTVNTKSIGTSTRDYNFVTGPRFKNDWEKTYTLDFGFGYFKVQARWGYDLGFMVPIKVTVETSPTVVSSMGKGAKKKATVAVKASVTDQSGSYYKAAGMDGMQHGKEVPITAYAEVRCRLKAFNVWIFTYTGGKGKKCQVGKSKNNPLDYSLDMKAPFGGQPLRIKPKNKNWQAAVVWIPESVTRTKKTFRVNEKLYAEVWAKAGVKFDGTGKASVRYKALINDEVVKNKRLYFTNSASKDGSFDLPARNNGYRYGYRLSDPRFEWLVTLVPGAQIGGKARAYGWRRNFSKTWWLDSSAFKIATAHLAATPGSNNKYTDKPGRRISITKKAAPAGVRTTPKRARPTRR